MTAAPATSGHITAMRPEHAERILLLIPALAAIWRVSALRLARHD
ncbi:hypothetical protein [Streptomyces sp. NPDC005231]